MKNMKFKWHFFLLITFISSFALQAQIKVAAIFSDNMVLQRHTKIPVWGWANANEKVTVQFNNQTKTTKADQTGKWIVRLDDEMAGGPYVLKIKGKNSIEIKNILVGEVWICSGQSNMEWTVGQADEAEKEIDMADFPQIRHVKIPKEINSFPASDIQKTAWEVCSPKTVADFTAIGYYYAKELNNKLKIPIGIINASWGGTNIETWISREGFELDSEFRDMIYSMPKIDIHSLLDAKMDAAKTRIEKIQNSKLNPENVSLYKDLNFKDSNWSEIHQPGLWEEQQLGNFDGVIWLRKHFTLSEITENCIIEIPAIDDNDITFINGIKIGQTNGWDEKRMYKIPSGILKLGDNVITIRVVDNGGGGGIYGNAAALKIILNNKEIPLDGYWKFQVESIKNSINENDFPSLCFNSMIHPLIPFAFKGVLWYQGESNVSRAFQYRKTFPMLISDWRKKWKNDFPFYYVQLATYQTTGNSNEGCAWAEIREAQTKTLSVKNTGMVVTTDVGNPNDIHPTNKKTVAKRLASIAFTNLNNENMISNGPTFNSFEKKEKQLIVTFNSLGAGLVTTNEYGFVNGFEIAGENQVFYPAKAYIKENKVVVSNENVLNPIAVRFGWIGDASECNLFNVEGFPAVPFRSDEWKTITKEEKYKIDIIVN